ncbi:MAG TPA: zinc ribbon domain-containing protein, partial [Myxococcaceae bacterium]|nr:zinc ribbon domain-containing protein [Myxococcaceae bacterium]
MRCPSCQQENPPNAKFCVECATPMPLACAQCGTQIPRTAKFCPECAHPTALAKAAPPSQPRAAQPVAPAALLGGPSVAVAPAAQAVQPLGAAASVPAGYPFRAVSAVPAPQNVAVGEPATSRQNTLADADASAVMQRLAQ